MSELLKRLGIVPGPGFRFGRNHATACPKCQHLRRKHPRARPLSIKLTSEGLYFKCWH